MKKLALIYFAFAVCAIAEDVKLGKSVISPDYIEIEKLKSTKNVIVIDKKDIDEKGYQNVSEVLDDVPGISVGTSDWGEIDIRGQGVDQAAKNIQVMVDGAPITTLVNHPYKTNYNIIPVEQIEKIEVIPGGGSVIYGNGTSGGVINITTNLKAMEKPSNKVGYEFTIDKEKKYYTNLGTKINDDLTVQVNYSKSEKDLYFIDTFSDTEYFSSGLNYKISDNQNISFKYSHFEEDGQFIKNISKANYKKYGKNYKPKERTFTTGLDENGLKITEKRIPYLSSNREEDQFKLSYDFKLKENIHLIVDGFANNGYFTQNEYKDDKEMHQKTLGTKTKLNIEYGEKNSLLFGVDYFKQNAELKYSDYKLNKDADGNIIKHNGKST